MTEAHCNPIRTVNSSAANVSNLRTTSQASGNEADCNRDTLDSLLGRLRAFSSLDEQKSLQEVKQAAECARLSEKPRMSHQEVMSEDMDDMAQNSVNGTFRSTLTFQTESSFEQGAVLCEGAEERWDILEKFKRTMMDARSPVAIAVAAIALLVGMEPVLFEGLSRPPLRLLGSLLLFVRAREGHSFEDAISPVSWDNIRIARHLKYAAGILLMMPAPNLQADPSQPLGEVLTTCVLVEACRLHMMSELLQPNHSMRWVASTVYLAWTLAQGLKGFTNTGTFWSVPSVYVLPLWIAAMRASSLAQHTTKRIVQDQRTVCVNNTLIATMLSNLMLPPRLSKLAASPLATSSLWMEEFPAVTVCFVSFSRKDFERFENPKHFLLLIGHCISMFDQVVTEQGLFKLEHVGEDYVVTSSCVRDGPKSFSHKQHEQETVNLVKLAQVLLEVSKKLTVGESKLSLQFRAGLHSGPCVGAIAGKHRRFYRLFGDTVNTAARMCQHAPPGGVHLSQAVFDLVQGYDLMLMERGVTNIKGKGPMPTYVSLRNWVHEREEQVHQRVQKILNQDVRCSGDAGENYRWVAAQCTEQRRHSIGTSTSVFWELRKLAMDSVLSYGSPITLEEARTWTCDPPLQAGQIEADEGADEEADEVAGVEPLSLCTKFDTQIPQGETGDLKSANNPKDTDAEELSRECTLSPNEGEDEEIQRSLQQLNVSDKFTVPITNTDSKWDLGPPAHLRRKGSCFSPRDSRFVFDPSAMTHSDKAARFESLHGHGHTRRAASFTFGCTNTRTLDLGLDQDQPETMYPMSDIKSLLQVCFPQSIQDELNEIMSTAMNLDTWEGDHGSGADPLRWTQHGTMDRAPWEAPPDSDLPPANSAPACTPSWPITSDSYISYTSVLDRPLKISQGPSWSADILSSLAFVPAADSLTDFTSQDDPSACALTSSLPLEESSWAQSKDAKASTGTSWRSNTLSGMEDEALSSLQTTSSHVEQRLLRWRQQQAQHKPLVVEQDDGLENNPPLSDDEDLSPFHAPLLEHDEDPAKQINADTPPNTPSGEVWEGVLEMNRIGLPLARGRSHPTPSINAPPEPEHGMHSGLLCSKSRLSRVESANLRAMRTGSCSIPSQIKPGALRGSNSNLATRNFAKTHSGLGARRRLVRQSEPGQKAKERISAQMKQQSKAQQDLSKSMSQPYLTDLLGFCEQYSSRSLKTLQWKERADRKSQQQISRANSGYSAPIARSVHLQNAEQNTMHCRASLIYNMSTSKERKVWEATRANSKSLHSILLGGFQNEKIENFFVARFLLQHQPSFWPMAAKMGLYLALAVNLWHSLPSSISHGMRTTTSAVMLMCISALRVPLGAAVQDPAADPSWTRVVPVGVVGMLLEALHPNNPPLSLTAFTLLLMLCRTFALQTQRSILLTLAALATLLLGELCRTGLFFSTLVSLRALLLFVFALILFVSIRFERKRSRMLWQSKYLHHKRSQTLSSVWHDLVPSVSAREFIFERRMWMDFSDFDEETMLQHYSLWIQMDRVHAVVLAMDMVNFTPLANSLSPCQVVGLLHEIWCLVDACVRDPELVEGHKVEAGEQNTMFKMDTIGDAYITVHLVEADSHEMQAAAIQRVMQLAANIQSELLALSVWKSCAGEMEPNSLRFRMGLSCDPVVAGVVGLLQPRYHVFGAAVENARHLEARAGGGMLRVQDDCLAMLPCLHGINMLNLEIFNEHDIPALMEMNAVVIEMQNRNGQQIKRPAIHRKLPDYVKAAENSSNAQNF